MRPAIRVSAAQAAIDVATKVGNEVHKNVDQLSPGSRFKSVEKLWAHCESVLDLPLKYLGNPASSFNHNIRSYYMKHPDRYEIVILKDLNYCWNRFAVCKELFHALLDDPSIRNPVIASHVDQMFAIGFSDQNNAPAENEIAAEIAALEYLFPYRERKRIVAARQTDYMAIATEFAIPRTYVESYLGSSTMANMAEMSYAGIPEATEED